MSKADLRGGDAVRVDRTAVLARHHPRVRGIDPRSPLQVGNGELAVAVDVTGLQTFPAAHPNADGGTLLGTQAQWGWHSIPWAGPGPEPTVDDTRRTYATPHGPTPYVDLSVDQWNHPQDPLTPAEEWMRSNPHRLDLGRIGLWWSEGASVDELSDVDQVLRLDRGALVSRFTLRGVRHEVLTCVHPGFDVLAVRVRRDGGAASGFGVGLAFPYGSPGWGDAQDWDRPDAHSTCWVAGSAPAGGSSSGTVHRELDATRYAVDLAATGATPAQTGPHEVRVVADGDRFELTAGFRTGDAEPAPVLSFEEVRRACERWWGAFWERGAAVDLGRVSDTRAAELERRVVLSQYVTAVNGAGSTPPAETGLLTSSWRGRFHLEMHWWHAAHFATWGRADLLERSLGWYRSILPVAREAARTQGLPGARWPKQTDPSGRETPSSIGPFLLWQQPHPIHLAELVRRSRPTSETLEEWGDVVLETAELMAAIAVPRTDGFGLGPPLVPAQESYTGARTTNVDPTFELTYWAWALQVACRWRRLLGLLPEPRWEEVAVGMRRPLARDEIYVALASEPYLVRDDHPSMLAALGVVPDVGTIDHRIMSATLESVAADWDWASAWGWDFPMGAMTAARLGRPDAVEWLLHPAGKNTYLANGHNWQTAELPAYLPGNGGLLQAVAVMCETGAFAAAGWDVLAEGFGGPEGEVDG